MSMSRADRNEATVRAFYALFSGAAFRAGDFRQLEAVLSPSFRDHDPIPGQGPGIEGLAQAFASFYASFGDFAVRVDDVVASERSAAVRLTFLGTHTGPFMGIPATGKRFEVQGFNVIHFADDGRPSARWGLADWSTLMAQLGIGGEDAALVTTVQGIYGAFGRGDVPAILGAMAPDIVWRSIYPAEVPFGGTFEGHDGVVRFLQTVGSTVDVLGFSPTKFVAGEGRVVVTGREKATVKATGREYENTWVHVFELDRGRVRRIETYNDAAAVTVAFASK